MTPGSYLFSALTSFCLNSYPFFSIGRKVQAHRRKINKKKKDTSLDYCVSTKPVSVYEMFSGSFSYFVTYMWI